MGRDRDGETERKRCVLLKKIDVKLEDGFKKKKRGKKLRYDSVSVIICHSHTSAGFYITEKLPRRRVYGKCMPMKAIIICGDDHVK